MYTLQRDPQLGHTWHESAGVMRKIGKTQILASKSLQRGHSVTHSAVHLCYQFLVQVNPVLLDLNCALSLLSRSQATFKPSLAQLRR